MEAMLKGPGTKRLELTNNEMLSNFACKFNLRRYTMVQAHGRAAVHTRSTLVTQAEDSQYSLAEINVVGRCRSTLSNPG
jgi:hypothetical protein